MKKSPPLSDEHIERLISGQKMVIGALIINIAGLLLRVSAPGPLVGILALAGICLALIGLFRLTSGLGYATTKRILLSIALVFPVVNIIVLAYVNSAATRVLREHGYRIGLLGAKDKT